MDELKVIELEDNSNYIIIYITLVVIVGLFLIWVLMVIFSSEDSILHNMTDLTTQLTPITDNQDPTVDIHNDVISIDILPQDDYHRE